MGIFDKRQSLSRGNLKKILRDDSGRIPETGGRKYHRAQREKIEREVFGSKYGSEISKSDYRSALRNLKQERNRVPDIGAKRNIDDKIRYLEELGGRSVE